MNLYKKLLEKELQEKENKRLERNKKALIYYYKNREYVLQRQRAKKLYNDQYYKQWYEKNKVEVQERRKAKAQNINKKYYTNKIYDNSKKEKPSFILFG